MTDREIRERRKVLEARHEQLCREWKAFDARYPCEVGAYKPPGYDQQQMAFADQICGVGQEIASLPTTKARKVSCVVTAFALLAIVVALGRWLWL